MPQKATEAEFINAWKESGASPTEAARILGISTRQVFQRRRRIEARGRIELVASKHMGGKEKKLPTGRIELPIENGVVVVGSDAHVWPGPLTTAQRGFIEVIRRLKPDVVVMNGDVFDGARVSRFPAGMWSQEHRPNVKQELEACQAFLDAVYAAYRPAKHYWTFGNHDSRFEARLAALTPEYEGVKGFALKDHFQEWSMCMSLWIGDTVIKHRWHNGLHAVHQNVLKGGKNIVTGHLHSLKVTPWTDYNGIRYGVDCGTLSDPSGPMFDYIEDNSTNWRAGFCVLTFRDGKLLLPELAQVWDEDHLQFRGEVLEV